MLTILQVTDVINLYHHNKGILKKLRRTEHPAIRATDEYLKSLKIHKGLLSNQDLFKINRFFLSDHPVKPGKASYMAWAAINYQNFCTLNYVQITHLSRLLTHAVPTKHAGFATCSKAGYQHFSEHFSKLTLEQLDNRSNAEKMQEFFQVLSRMYQKIKLHDKKEINLSDENVQDIIFNEDHFLALSKLCVEGMLTEVYINAILKSNHANILAISLIYLKRKDSLNLENQQFIFAYSGMIIPMTHSLVALKKAGLNTLGNREILANLPFPVPLHRTIKCLEKKELLTQANFDFISAENNLSWLIALEEMPDELITAEIWKDLLNLSKKTNIENELRKDIKEYAEQLRKKLNIDYIEKDILACEEQIETQAKSSTIRFFPAIPANPTPPTEREMPMLGACNDK